MPVSDRNKIRIITGQQIKTWGGWYRRDSVLLDGESIGFIQTRRRNKRTEVDTCGPVGSNVGVLGSNIDWLIRTFGEQARAKNREKRTRVSTTPHGRCERAGHCVEHEADPSVEPCQIGR